MNKKIIIIGTIVVIIAIVILVIYKFVPNLSNNDQISKDSRTLYTGNVSIEQISFSDIKNNLDKQGCHQMNSKKIVSANDCYYQEEIVPVNKISGIIIFPKGRGFGPSGFYITPDNKLWAEKDIVGAPDTEVFKAEVRKDVSSIGGAVKIIESSWQVTDTKYPWDVQY